MVTICVHNCKDGNKVCKVSRVSKLFIFEAVYTIVDANLSERSVTGRSRSKNSCLMTSWHCCQLVSMCLQIISPTANAWVGVEGKGRWEY